MIEVEQQRADYSNMRAASIRPHPSRGVACAKLEQEPAMSQARVADPKQAMELGVEQHVDLVGTACRPPHYLYHAGRRDTRRQQLEARWAGYLRQGIPGGATSNRGS